MNNTENKSYNYLNSLVKTIEKKLLTATALYDAAIIKRDKNAAIAALDSKITLAQCKKNIVNTIADYEQNMPNAKAKMENLASSLESDKLLETIESY